MTKVRIKCNNSKEPEKRLKLLQLLSENEICVNKLLLANEGFTIFTYNDGDLDRLFNGITDKYLERNGFTPIIPPELKENRSIILFNEDQHIFNHEEDDMLKEIMDKNLYTNNQITEVLKFPRSKIIKITFTKTTIAKRATESGLRMYSMSIHFHQMQQDKFFPIQTCMRCYKIEDHNPPECPKPTEYKICSECTMEGHRWKDCTNIHKLPRGPREP